MLDMKMNSKAKDFLEQGVIPPFFGGSWVSCSGDAGEVINPASGETLAQVEMVQSKGVDSAVDSASKAFSSWSAMSASARAVLLHRLADAIEENSEVLAQLEALDLGKPIQNARVFDVPCGAECLRYFADLSVQTAYDVPLAIKEMEARIHYAPYGVCGFIFPWNFPFTLFCWGVAPALAAGNTVVVKASEVTPLSTLYVGKLAQQAGIPDGVINILTGSGSEGGQPLAEHPKVKCMSFTGSTNVGKLIGRICGERLVPCKLELGGKGAAIVFDDADIAAAAEGLAGAITLNTEQICCTATRWFLHESVYDDFVDQVRSELAKTNIGIGMDENSQMAPLVSQVQLDRVKSYYGRGLAEGASSIVPLERPEVLGGSNGFFVSPHLLSGNDDNLCFREEVFGPTAFLVKFKDQSDAINRVNKIAYGLANSVWNSDIERANVVAEQIISGNSWINAHNVFAYGLPYGGVNLSGLGGGVNSPETFRDYLRPQTIARAL